MFSPEPEAGSGLLAFDFVLELCFGGLVPLVWLAWTLTTGGASTGGLVDQRFPVDGKRVGHAAQMSPDILSKQIHLQNPSKTAQDPPQRSSGSQTNLATPTTTLKQIASICPKIQLNAPADRSYMSKHQSALSADSSWSPASWLNRRHDENVAVHRLPAALLV